MSALRVHRPGEPVNLVDLGPATPYRNPFASLSGRRVEPRIDLVPDQRREQLAEAQRRYRARQKAGR